MGSQRPPLRDTEKQKLWFSSPDLVALSISFLSPYLPYNLSHSRAFRRGASVLISHSSHSSPPCSAVWPQTAPPFALLRRFHALSNAGSVETLFPMAWRPRVTPSQKLDLQWVREWTGGDAEDRVRCRQIQRQSVCTRTLLPANAFKELLAELRAVFTKILLQPPTA